MCLFSLPFLFLLQLVWFFECAYLTLASDKGSGGAPFLRFSPEKVCGLNRALTTVGIVFVGNVNDIKE
jgi:hypothetical protein